MVNMNTEQTLVIWVVVVVLTVSDVMVCALNSTPESFSTGPSTGCERHNISNDLTERTTARVTGTTETERNSATFTKCMLAATLSWRTTSGS